MCNNLDFPYQTSTQPNLATHPRGRSFWPQQQVVNYIKSAQTVLSIIHLKQQQQQQHLTRSILIHLRSLRRLNGSPSPLSLCSWLRNCVHLRLFTQVPKLHITDLSSTRPPPRLPTLRVVQLHSTHHSSSSIQADSEHFRPSDSTAKSNLAVSRVLHLCNQNLEDIPILCSC